MRIFADISQIAKPAESVKPTDIPHPPTVHTYESLIAMMNLASIRVAYIENRDQQAVDVHLQAPRGRYLRFRSNRTEMLIFARIDLQRGAPVNEQKLMAAGSPGFWVEILEDLLVMPETEQTNFPPLEEPRMDPYNTTIMPFKKGGPNPWSLR